VGTRLDRLYPQEEYKWLNYKEIDEIVRGYKEAADEQAVTIHRAGLLRAFHKYFMKYVSLLKGTIGSIDNSDTISFLALFLNGPGKGTNDYLGIYRYIRHVCKSLENEDIYNELATIFISLLDKFEFRPEVSFSRYITKYMRWSIKAWIMEMARNPLTRSPIEYESYLEDSTNPQIISINAELPIMDLAWVSKTSSPLFSVLTRYERFLLYMNYKEGLGVRQISERLGRAKDTIHSHLQQALRKLREQYQKGEQ
jgi:RNA polymerase sigma factor (sigma-70 family)